MSGMSSDHSGIGGGGGMMPPSVNGGDDYCLRLEITTNLATVNIDVLSKTQEGDVLPVSVQGADGPVVVLNDGDILGSILSRFQVKLINCINKGTEYEALVEKIDGAICQVKISAVR
jgi:hypothetical protein